MRKLYWATLIFTLFPLCSQAMMNNMQKPMAVTQDAQLVTRIQAIGWLKACDGIIEKLVLIKVPYWGFDHKTHEGQLVVHQAVAQDLEEIFQILHKNKFPIEKIKTMDNYQNNDDASMRDNNTSVFNCRMKIGKNELSNHGYGIAIDINPRMNPYVKGEKVLPENSGEYMNRNQSLPGMITKNSLIYKLFKERGWEWGGDWTELKDYQHFEKLSVIK